MAVFQGKISGYGNAATRTNEITADDVAVLRNYIIGWDSMKIHISGDVYYNFLYDYTDTSFSLSRGIVQAYGYMGILDKPLTFVFNKTAATQYHFIYAEIDKSVVPNVFSIKIKNNQASSIIKDTTFRQDVLSLVKTGVYQLPLYRITINENGINEIEDIVTTAPIKRVKHTNVTQSVTKQIASEATAVTQSDTLTAINEKRIATLQYVHNVVRNYIDNN